MPLKIITIKVPLAGEIEYQEWISSNPGIKINTKHICPHTIPPAVNSMGFLEPATLVERLYIFYDTPGDAQFNKDKALIDQNAQWEMCMDVAKALKGDAHYRVLKNKDQRRFYLLNTYHIPRDDADVVDTILQMDKLGALNAKPARVGHDEDQSQV